MVSRNILQVYSENTSKIGIFLRDVFITYTYELLSCILRLMWSDIVKLYDNLL